jgi:hypothetical protein
VAAVTAVGLARAIHDAHVRAARARSRPWRRWEDLSAVEVHDLIRNAEQLQLEYAAAGDPPSGPAKKDGRNR